MKEKMVVRIEAALSSLALSAVLLSACGKSIDVAQWTEEVKLHDGTIVTVWRSARAYSNGFPNSSRGRDIDFDFKYEPMNLEWKGDWSRIPLSFEIVDGVAYLALIAGDKQFCNGRPPTDYAGQLLRWSSGHWVDVKQSDFPTTSALVNLSMDYWGNRKEEDYRGQIAWKSKRLPGGYNQEQPDTVASFFPRYHHLCQAFQQN